MNLDDYHKQILTPAIKRFTECEAYELFQRQRYMENLKFYGWKAPTRWEKFKTNWSFVLVTVQIHSNDYNLVVTFTKIVGNENANWNLAIVQI